MPARNKGTTTCCMTSFTRRRQRVEQWRTGTQLHYTCKKSSQGMTMNQRIVELCWAFANERTNENTTPSFTLILWQWNRSKKSYLHDTTLLVVPLRCAKSKLLRNCWLQRRQREVNITRLSQNKLHPQNIRMEMMLSPSISHGVYWIQCSSKEKINSNSPGKDAVMYTAFSEKNQR